MQNTASLPTDQFEELLRRLPAALDLDSLARQTKAIERRRALDSGADLLRLALARGPGGLSLSETAAWATMLGLAEMSDPAVKYRLDIRRSGNGGSTGPALKALDPRSLVAAEFMILGTSLPTEGYPAGEVLMVYRLRWQIELAFKRLKSLLRMDRIPTQTERASRSWLTAHLILALLCDDLGQDFLASSP